MTDEEARAMHEELIHRRWPGSSGWDKPWRYVVNSAQTSEGRAICLALELLALTVYTPDDLTRFREEIPE